MAALPYMQLYIADYLADTMHLTTEEHGAYLLLIFNYWQTGKPIPKNRLSRIARLSNDRWSSVEESLSEFFSDDGTSWTHKRIEADLAMVEEAQAQRAAAGRASAEARKRAKLAESKRKPNDRSTPVDVSLGRDDNGNPTNKDTDTDTDKSKKNKQKKSSPLVTFNGWLDLLRESGEEPIPEGSAVFRYAEEAGIPSDYLRMFWVEFKARYSLDDKKYKDWRAVFTKAVRGNWFQLWWHDGTEYHLTSRGHQAMTAMNNQEAA